MFMAVPNGPLLWQDFPWDLVRQAIKQNPDADIAQVEGWRSSQSFQLNPTVLRLALRRGIACSRGIVFDNWLFPVADRAQLLARSHAEASASQAALPQWAQHPEHDVAIHESLQNSISEARTELDKELAVPAKAELVQHWRNLGGFLPDPL